MTREETARAERAAQIARFDQYLVSNTPIAMAMGVLFLVLALVYGSARTLIVAGFSWAMAAVYLWARRTLRRGEFEAAVVAPCIAMLIVPVATILVSSATYAVAAMVAIWPVVIALPYVGRRLLRLLMIGTIVTAVTTAALAFRPPAEWGVPDWMLRCAIVGVTAVLTALVQLLLWQYHTRLNDVNAALRESERALEARLEELSRSREALAAARDQALRANEAKSAFLANVSHELRTPLTSVLGFSKLIKKRLAEVVFPAVPSTDVKTARAVEQIRTNVDIIASEGERLTKLINDVLDLAKIEAGKVEWSMQPTNLQGVIEQAVAATASLFEGRPITLRVDADDALPEIEADRDRLIQVMVNLISNAVKFTRAGSIECRARHTDGHVEVSVADTGVGIAEEDCAKVFEQFVQVGDDLTDKPQGTGLGLPICKQIVQHHGGRIWVESERGTGTTVIFTLPVAGGARRAGDLTERHLIHPVDVETIVARLRAHAFQGEPRGPADGKTILVVDDDEAIRELLRQELVTEGYHVREAGDGQEALADVRRARPDLIILDVMMPGLSGFDVAAILRNDPTTFNIPIFILSVLHDEKRGYRVGVDRYFTKPLDSRALLDEVNVWMTRGTSKKRVLVIDEDAGTVRTLADALEAQGYIVAAASSGEEGIAKAVVNHPDLVVVRSLVSEKSDLIKTLRFEKGLEKVYFLVFE